MLYPGLENLHHGRQLLVHVARAVLDLLSAEPRDLLEPTSSGGVSMR